MRKYTKRTKSTASKTYTEYLADRNKLEAKGYQLNTVMSKDQFENLYSTLKEARKAGELKSQPYQELLRRERYLASNKQVKVLAKAANKLYGKKWTQQMIYRADPMVIAEIGEYINKTKSSGIYGGDYE